MQNKTIARIFNEIASILEVKGENVFRVRAYEKAARVLEGLPQDIKTLAAGGSLEDLPGIGKDLAGKIREILSSGTCQKYEDLKKNTPEGLLKMLTIPGIGPKTVRHVHEELGIDTIEKLRRAAQSGRLLSVEGIKEKTQENILKGIEYMRSSGERVFLSEAVALSESLREKLKKLKEVQGCEVAGSVRRRKEMVKDIDLLVVSRDPEKVSDQFTALDVIKDVKAKGPTKTSVTVGEDNVQVDLRVVDRKSFAAALMYFTGSKGFNIRLRQMAIDRGYKINEYGVFAKDSGKKIKAPNTEKGIFKLFGMQYIPPELREDNGEVDLALKNDLPSLIETGDIRGDFHVHSRYSDGEATIDEVAYCAERLGYEYLAVADHSQGLKIAGGLSVDRLHEKMAEIKKINRSLKKVRLLCAAEVDIDAEGGLDYPQEVLKELDVVIAAVHSGFKQSQKQLTQRIVRACKNKYVHIIAHPTGRLLGARGPYEIDLDEVLRVARDHKVALELNCYPQRLDLNEIHCRQAKEAGVKIALGSDSHSLSQLANMKLGVCIGRRGWLTPDDVVNCFSKQKLLQWLKK